jgi:hypothetical protein
VRGAQRRSRRRPVARTAYHRFARLGGKLRYKSTERRFYVDGYLESETPAMLATEERINAALAEFCAAWTGPSPWRAP